MHFLFSPIIFFVFRLPRQHTNLVDSCRLNHPNEPQMACKWLTNGNTYLNPFIVLFILRFLNIHREARKLPSNKLWPGGGGGREYFHYQSSVQAIEKTIFVHLPIHIYIGCHLVIYLIFILRPYLVSFFSSHFWSPFTLWSLSTNFSVFLFHADVWNSMDLPSIYHFVGIRRVKVCFSPEYISAHTFLT